MTGVFVVLPGAGAQQKAQHVFQAGLHAMQALKSLSPTDTFESPTVSVAAFARRSGTGGAVEIDPHSGTWLVAAGTWFHDAGYGSGQESRLLKRFSEVGAVRLAKEIEGFFFIACGDPRSREVSLITDVVGTFHSYIRVLDGVVAISTSSLALAALDQVTLDPLGCQEFLQTAAMYEDRTFYREVRKLPEGRCMTFVDGRLQSDRRYWHVSDLAIDSLDGADALEAYKTSFVSAARKISNTFPHPIVDLTGGYDSRGGVAAFLAAGVPFVTAVSGGPSDPDVVVSSTLAKRLGLDHRYLPSQTVTSFEQLRDALRLTDGEYDLVDYARISATQSVHSRNADISVNSYSGEIGRGYGWELLLPHTGKRQPLDCAKVAARRFVNRSFDASIVRPDVRIDPTAHFRDVMERTDKGLTHLPNTVQYDYCMTMMRCQRWYGRIASSTDQILSCMSFFLLRSIIEPMMQTTARSKRRSLVFRQLFADVSPELTKVPLALGYPPVPASMATIHRFWPMVPLYGGKVAERIRRSVGLKRPDFSDSLTTQRLVLWEDPEIRHTLDPSNALSTEVLDATGLASFIELSKVREFGSSSLWALVLTLECTLQALKAARAEVAAQAAA